MDWHIALTFFAVALAILLLSQAEDALWGVLTFGISRLASILIDAIGWLVRNRA